MPEGSYAWRDLEPICGICNTKNKAKHSKTQQKLRNRPFLGTAFNVPRLPVGHNICRKLWRIAFHALGPKFHIMGLSLQHIRSEKNLSNPFLAIDGWDKDCIIRRRLSQTSYIVINVGVLSKPEFVATVVFFGDPRFGRTIPLRSVGPDDAVPFSDTGQLLFWG